MQFRTMRNPSECAPLPQLAKCPQCDEQLIAPEWLEYFGDKSRVRHVWKCESCGYVFETTMSFAADRGRRRSDRQRPLTRTWWW
jgi:transcription elongation factor Elf1